MTSGGAHALCRDSERSLDLSARSRALSHFCNARPTLYRNAPVEHAGNGGENLKSGKKLSVHPT
jgi:hypothetical protein